MSQCENNCSKHIYHMNKNCCKARWLSSCFAPHAPAMLDKWQQQDTLQFGRDKAVENRAEIVKMGKTLAKAKHEKQPTGERIKKNDR